jgi:hypothetical protein
VQELRGNDQKEIQALSRRLNYVVERLNPQELRHSQYFGEFIDDVESLTKETFWDDVGLFSRRDAQRMKDTEFISELFIVVVDGIQEQQKTLDDFYAAYDVVFQKKARSIARFKRVLTGLQTISETIRDTRFRNKSDFYALFAAVNELSSAKTLDLTAANDALLKLSKALDAPPETLKGTPQEYYTTIAEGANKFAKRVRRMEILRDILNETL